MYMYVCQCVCESKNICITQPICVHIVRTHTTNAFCQYANTHICVYVYADTHAAWSFGMFALFNERKQYVT